jgi:hypothetical protein
VWNAQDPLRGESVNSLTNYDAACFALQQAASVDEVLTIRDQAEAMRAYGRQAKNRELESYAQEIRLRAERKLGGLIIAQKESVGLNSGAKGIGKSAVVADDRTPTLADMGISKDLSSRAQKLASVPDAEFESHLVEHKQRIAAENARVVNKLETAGDAAIKVKKAPPQPADAELTAENQALREQLAEIAENMKTTLADNEMMGRVFDADDRIKAAMDEAIRQKAIAENAERTLLAKSGEFIERARAVTHWQNRAVKAEKALAKLGNEK